MANADPCPICLEPYTAKTRQQVKCAFCPAVACRPCQQQALLNSYADPACYGCKAGWSADFLAANFPLTFRTQTLRKHRRKILLEREKAMLPAMQVFVEAERNIRRITEERTRAWGQLETQRLHYERLILTRGKQEQAYHLAALLRTERKEVGVYTEESRQEYRAAKRAYLAAKEEALNYWKTECKTTQATFHTISAELWRWQRILAGEEGDKQRREFIMRCPAEGCRGFLSTAYKCGVCEKSTCKDCLEVLPETDAHTCNPATVESAKMIKKETRPCPKCGTRIFKIEGCDQMYCTMEGCHTAFSWNTGHVVTGRIHNPHYYEWLRRNGGDLPMRENGEIPCGGFPIAWAFTRVVLRSMLTTETKNRLLEIHRNATEFEERLRSYPARPPALMNKELNIRYLMNELSEVEWQTQMEHAEARFNRKKEIGQILQTLTVAAADALREIHERLTESDEEPQIVHSVAEWIRETALPMLEALRSYTNGAFKDLGKAQHMAVPQVNEKWHWLPARIYYKGNKGTDKGGAKEDGTNEIVEAT